MLLALTATLSLAPSARVSSRPRSSPRLRHPLLSTTAPSTVVSSAPASKWLDLWYPVIFSALVPDDGLVSATIFERPLVLFRAEDGGIQCLADQCPHRLAPLSDGRLATDPKTGAKRLECSYHGWQFSGCGSCTKLPQLDSQKTILPLYNAKSYPVEESQGILYVFLGDAGLAPKVPVPRVEELYREGWIYEQDYMRDLPYDYTTLVENIIDPSHVPVSHHGTTQGNRALAQPLKTKVSMSSATAPLGFSGETEVPLHGSSRLGLSQQSAKQNVQFTAPSLLSYKFSVGAGDACALFYPIPVSRGRSRILVRRGRNFATDRKLDRPALVAKHLENNVVFDQDMAFLRGQEARLQALRTDGWGGAWRPLATGDQSYVMPAEADRFVISLRKQLDSVASALPWRSPPNAQAAYAPPLPRRALLDRMEQHTKHCPACTEALALTELCIKLSKVALQASLTAFLVALACSSASAARLCLVSALGASVYSAALLQAYVVGPVLNALPNRVAATPLATAVASLAALALLPMARVVHMSSVLIPIVTAGCAAWAIRALEGLRARFIYSEEAKALQDS